MPQHLAYKLWEDGYYYFRPYNYTQVSAQQSFVSQWGGDTRNPYALELLDELETENLPAPEMSEPNNDSSQSRAPTQRRQRWAFNSDAQSRTGPVPGTAIDRVSGPRLDMRQLGIVP
jgi:hypothetical protein